MLTHFHGVHNYNYRYNTLLFSLHPCLRCSRSCPGPACLCPSECLPRPRWCWNWQSRCSLRHEPAHCKLDLAKQKLSNKIHIRVGGGSQTFFSTHGNHLPSLSGVHGLKDFLHSDHLLEWFDVRSYTYGSVLKSNFYHERTQEDGHIIENPSKHELLTVRGVDCRASKKMFWGVIPV